jgi:hypothetical protein
VRPAFLRFAPAAAILVAGLLSGCGSSDTPPRTVQHDVATAVPATPPAGFASLDLLPAPEVNGGDPDASPVGSFWYRFGDGGLEWFVRAQHLESGLAYRVELTVNNSARYSVASLRADAAGALVGHGSLPAFVNQTCVSVDADRSQPFSADEQMGVAIKTDGAPSSGGQGVSPTSPEQTLPCSGNGDGRWVYVLLGRHDVPLGAPIPGNGS